MGDSLEAREVARAAFKHRIKMCCIWSWAVCGIGFFLTFGVLAGFIPPHLERWSADQVANFYAANRTTIRLGLIGALFFSALLLPFFTVISQEMREIEGPKALLAPIQFAGAIVLVTFFQIICLLWLLASLRPDISHQIIRAENDYGWIVWTILIPTYSAQFICMALAGFMDIRETPLWPRWAAYMNLWVAFLGAGGCCSVFFKHGPFSWNGIIGWWVPTIVFAGGMCVNMWLLHVHATATEPSGTRVNAPESPPAHAVVAGSPS
jgi:hypothetical protein